MSDGYELKKYEFDKVPEPLVNFILDYVSKDSHGHREDSFKDNVLHCTELLYCLRKAYYDRIFIEEQLRDEEINVSEKLKKVHHIFRGRLFDELLVSENLFEKVQVPVTHRIKGTDILIRGVADFIYEDRVWDLKAPSYSSKSILPKKEHIRQVAFYTWALAMVNGGLIYITPHKILTVEIDFDIDFLEDNVEYMEERALCLTNCLRGGTPPPQERSTFCRWCPYKDICD